MQRKIQVNQVLHEFSHYGIILYTFASIFFFQTIFDLSTAMIYKYSNGSPSTYLLTLSISDLIIGAAVAIVIFFLMLKAIKIRSKAQEPATRNLTIFSILWFVFYTISYLRLIPFIYNQISAGPTGLPVPFSTILFGSLILSPIFQLLVWISLRKFFLDRDDIFPIKTTRSILNRLILIMFICTSTLFFLFVQTITMIGDNSRFHFSFSYTMNSILWAQFTYIPMWILLIIGYILLGYKLRKLKISEDTSILEN